VNSAKKNDLGFTQSAVRTQVLDDRRYYRIFAVIFDLDRTHLDIGRVADSLTLPNWRGWISYEYNTGRSKSTNPVGVSNGSKRAHLSCLQRHIEHTHILKFDLITWTMRALPTVSAANV